MRDVEITLRRRTRVTPSRELQAEWDSRNLDSPLYDALRIARQDARGPGPFVSPT